MGGEREDDGGNGVHEAGEHDLERVDPLELVVEGEAEDREQQDPLGGAEIAAIDPLANTPTVAAGPA